MKYDYLIVGSGLYGTTVAQQLKQAGKSVLVIDKRPHIAGNVYTEKVEGINVHKYAVSWKDSRIAKRIFSDSQPTGAFPIPTTQRNKRSGSPESRRRCPDALEPRRVLSDLRVC